VTEAMPVHPGIRNERARSLQGRRAGFASRLAADGIDWVVVVLIYTGILLGIELAAWLLLGEQFQVKAPKVAFTIGFGWSILVTYLAIGWTGNGRTVGKSVMGLRVVRGDGTDLGSRKAFLRALICASFWPWVLCWSLLSRRNAGFHDLLLRTAVIYDWTSRT